MVNEPGATLRKKSRNKISPCPGANQSAPTCRFSILKANRSLIAIWTLFLISRLIYWLLGIRFDDSSLNWFWQYLDPQLLLFDFSRSIFYLHSQPPGMNIFLGIILHLFPGWETHAFWLCYLLFGLSLTTCLYLLLKELTLMPLVAVILTGIFITSPACILYENWLFYTYPVCVVLVFSALCWVKFLKRPRFIYSFLHFLGLGFVTLTWSLFHLIWILACFVSLFLFRRRYWKTIALSFFIPFLLVFCWYGKNAILFRQFTASTWLGMNFSKMTNSMLWPEERKELYKSGTISPVSLIPPFSELEKYEPYLEPQPLSGVSVLDQRKKASGVPNFNNIAYIQVSRAYGQDALMILIKKPVAYLRGLAEALGIFFIPADNYYFLRLNRLKIKTFARIFNTIFLGQFNDHLDTSLRKINPVAFYLNSLTNTGFFLIAAYIFAFIYGFLLMRRRHPSSQPFFFLWLTFAYTFFVGNFTEVGENNRFRFVLDPLILPFIGLLIQRLVTRLKKKN